MMGRSLWIVCPMYRDAPAFIELRRRICEQMSLRPEFHDLSLRFAVVEDTAGIDAEARSLLSEQDLRLIEPPFNLGHQRALVYGLRLLVSEIDDDDIVVTLDSDGEDKPEDVPRLVARLVAPDAHQRGIVIARRTKRRTSLGFKFSYVAFRAMFRLLTGTSVRSGNFAAYRGSAARRMLTHPNFDLSYSSALLSVGLPVQFVPCARGRRFSGDSRMGVSRLLLHGLRMLMPFVDRIAIRALTLFSVTLGLTFLLAAAFLVVRLFTDVSIPAWASFGLFGVMIISLLALGNFIVLFILFSQSRSVSFADLEDLANERRA